MSMEGQILDIFSTEKLKRGAFNDPTMSADQVDAARVVTGALLNGQPSCLTGSAGTGKSYTAARIAEWLVNQGLNILMCAPTHKAANVLTTQLLTTALSKKPVYTVHSLCGLVPKFKDGKQLLMQVGERIDKSCDVLFVDEVSMIGPQVYEHVMSLSRKHQFTVVMIGDLYQLPPTDSNNPSPAFYDPKVAQARLTTIHRQAEGSPIIDLATAIRDSMINKKPLPQLKEFLCKDIKKMSLEKWSRSASKQWRKRGSVSDIMMICYTNARVLSSAYTLRRLRDGLASREPMPGETLIANDTVLDPERRDEILINNNDYCRVYDSAEKADVAGVPGWYVTVISSGEEKRVFMPERIEGVKEHLKVIAGKALRLRDSGEHSEAREVWTKYFYLRNSCADLRPPYAQTVHKSQGSGYERVFLDLRDLAVMARTPSAEHYPNALYTAITRARERILIVGDIA